MMKWIKEGHIFSPHNEYYWMCSHAQIPFPLEFEHFIRVYFATREGYDSNGQCKSYGAFVDIDRNDFKKILNISKRPLLPLGGPGTFDEHGIHPLTVLRHENEYLLYYVGWSRHVGVPFKQAIGLAKSSDGEHFTKCGIGPIIGDNLYEPYTHSCPVVYKINGMFHLFYTTGIDWISSSEKYELQYVIRHATSKDGVSWSFDYKNIIAQKLEYECQNSPSLLFINGKYYMFFCYRYGLDFRFRKGRGYTIGVAVSSDLYEWTRLDENVGIELSDNGWDSEMLCYPYVKEIDNTWYMFYCGNQFGKEGFGYARLESLD